MLNAVVLNFMKGQWIKEFGLGFGGGGFTVLVTLMVKKPISRVRPAILFYFTIYFFKVYVFTFLAALGFHCCTQAFSSCGEQRLLFVAVLASHCGGFSCCGARALGTQALVAAAHGP